LRLIPGRVLALQSDRIGQPCERPAAPIALPGKEIDVRIKLQWEVTLWLSSKRAKSNVFYYELLDKLTAIDHAWRCRAPDILSS
jgi:hypothetical protein